jgi:hypothetical protein
LVVKIRFSLVVHLRACCYREENYKKLKDQIKRVLNVQRLRVFYLSDDISNNKNRVENVSTRSRGSCQYFIEHMYPFHENWHVSHGATVTNVKGQESIEVARFVYEAL